MRDGINSVKVGPHGLVGDGKQRALCVSQEVMPDQAANVHRERWKEQPVRIAEPSGAQEVEHEAPHVSVCVRVLGRMR